MEAWLSLLFMTLGINDITSHQYTYLCKCTYVYIYMCVCVCVRESVCVCVCACVYPSSLCNSTLFHHTCSLWSKFTIVPSKARLGNKLLQE